jgi:hypothetical protein
MRALACAKREAGVSWQGVLAAAGLPMLSTTTVRRWVASVLARMPAMAAAVTLWRAAGPAGPMAGYAPVAAVGSFGALTEAVADLLAGEVAGWPADEPIAGANWQASMRRAWLSV